MYRRRQGVPLVRLIVLGVFAGIVFLIFDSLRHAGQPGEAPPPLVQATPLPATPIPDLGTQVVPTPTATPDPSRPLPNQSTLFIPSAGIFTPIVEVYLDGQSWDVSALGPNVGHLEGTAWVNRPGNIGLSGHVELADGSAGVFAHLDELKVGDLIEIQQAGDVFRYSVAEVGTTTPDDISVLFPSTVQKLTLITCGDYNFLQNSYLTRVVVTAIRIG